MGRSGKAPALFRSIAAALLTIVISGLLGAALIRYGPGFEFDEDSLDPRISPPTEDAIRRENTPDPNLFIFYGRYLKHAMHGDFGKSRSLHVPVAELIRSRSAITLRLLGLGLMLGWCVGLALAAAAVYFRFAALNLACEALSGVALSLPAAVFALTIFLARGPVFLVLGLAVFPRVFRYGRDLFERARSGTRVEAARARGVPESAIFRRYILGPSAAPLIALAGVSFTIAFGALIPVEVVCDIPGIGQLAWKAALARDLPVLVSLTLLVTTATVFVNAIAEWMRGGSLGTSA